MQATYRHTDFIHTPEYILALDYSTGEPLFELPPTDTRFTHDIYLNYEDVMALMALYPVKHYPTVYYNVA
jgi:hypothetical protein